MLLGGPLLGDARTQRSELDGIVYETRSYVPRLPPEISLSVAGAIVTRQAFDDYTRELLPDAESIEGVGDAATYSTVRESLRVLVGSTLIVVGARRHPRAREATIAAARRALDNLSRLGTDGAA